MKNQNKSLEKNSVFSRIKSCWYNIFHNSKNAKDKLNDNKDTNVSVNNQFEVMNTFDEYRKKNERYQYLMQLQSKFENKKILESDISGNDKADLEALYIEQIDNLKRKIRAVDNKINTLN